MSAEVTASFQHDESQQASNDGSVYSIFIPSEYFISNHFRKIAEIVLDYTLSFSISVLGVVCNIIVIAVFSKQGFKDSVNITMTSIAIWDLIKCLSAAVQRLAGPVSLIDEPTSVSWTNISVVVFTYLVCFSSYVSSVLAAYVAVERCLCVSIPFKVKDILTPKVTFWICFSISVCVFGCFVVVWGIYDIAWVMHPTYNRTVAIYRYNSFYYAHKGPLFDHYNLSGIVFPTFSFVVIVICTAIIVDKLRRSSKFRASSLSEAESKNQLSKRDKQVVKMLLVVIIVYVINLSPRIALYTAKYFIYEFYFLRKYHNLLVVVAYVIFLCDVVNGAVNMFIFLAMSTSFRTTFKEMFPCFWREKETNQRASDDIDLSVRNSRAS